MGPGDGTTVGSGLGRGDGYEVGTRLGSYVGTEVGTVDGRPDGFEDGRGEGLAVGSTVGSNDGAGVGRSEGRGLGAGVGKCVRLVVSAMTRLSVVAATKTVVPSATVAMPRAPRPTEGKRVLTRPDTRLTSRTLPFPASATKRCCSSRVRASPTGPVNEAKVPTPSPRPEFLPPATVVTLQRTANSSATNTNSAFRTQLLLESATYSRVPSAPAAIPKGSSKAAEVPRPSTYPGEPLPAIVETTRELTSTFRIAWLFRSHTQRASPSKTSLVTATATGWLKRAEVPVASIKPDDDGAPATVETIPTETMTLFIWWFKVSTT